MSSGHRRKPLARFGALNGALARGLLYISNRTGSVPHVVAGSIPDVA